MVLSATPIVGPGSNFSTPASADFQFINIKGQEVSYYGFNQFRIYTKDTNEFIAFADIPLSVTTTKYVPGPLDNNIAPGTAQAISSGSSASLAIACLLVVSSAAFSLI
jgi:hypothetical protein